MQRAEPFTTVAGAGASSYRGTGISVAAHVVVMAVAFGWLQRAPRIVPYKLPGTAHGVEFLASYSPGSATEARSVEAKQKTVAPKQTALAHPVLSAPRQVEAQAASVETGTKSSSLSGIGEGDINIALQQYFPYPKPDLSALPANLNPRIPELIKRCLDKQPKKRWQSMGDLRVELESLAAAPYLTPQTSSTIAAVPTPLWKRAIPITVAVAITAVISTLDNLSIPWVASTTRGFVASAGGTGTSASGKPSAPSAIVPSARYEISEVMQFETIAEPSGDSVRDRTGR